MHSLHQLSYGDYILVVSHVIRKPASATLYLPHLVLLHFLDKPEHMVVNMHSPEQNKFYENQIRVKN